MCCTVVGKWFPEYGWVGIKNRDRNYIPEISFKKIHTNGLEVLLYWDNITQYSEGFNSNGVSILSASLMVADDEKEIQKRSKHPSKDGVKIKKALKCPTLKEAIQSLIDSKLTGNTLIFNQYHMFVLEGSWKPGEYKTKGYEYRIREIPKDQYVVRTNHGVWIKWAGYQRVADDKNQTMSRISSESRRAIGEIVTEEAKTPEEIIDGLTRDFTHNGQLNALRTTRSKKKMRTTAQILIIPKERTMYFRPVQSHLIFNFWDFNNSKQKTWVELLSNRVLYSNLKTLGEDPPFSNSLDHKL